MNMQIDSALKRARGYWFVDGFIEMAAGGLFILLAVILLFSGNTSQSSFPYWFLSITVEIGVAKIIGILVAVLVLWWLKYHFTYPRTGFVRGKRINAAQLFVIIRNVLLFLLLPILALLAISLLIASERTVLASMPGWFPIGICFMWAILYLLGGDWMGLRRFRLLAVLILLTGIAIGIWQFAVGLPTLPVNVFESVNRTLTGLSILILISGVILMISGLVTFLRYRKENPNPYTEEL